MKFSKFNWLNKIISTILIFGLWEFVGLLKFLGEELPRFSSVISYLFDSKNSHETVNAGIVTLIFTLISVFIGGLLGYVFGILMGNSKTLYSLFYNGLNALKSIPMIILFPLFLSIFGLDNYRIPLMSTPIFAIFSVNVANACLHINENRNFLITVMKVTKLNYFFHIQFWETLEVLFATLRISVTYALALEIALDYIFHHNGLGNFIYEYYYGNLETKYLSIYSAILLTSFLGVFLVYLTDIISNKILQWKSKT